MFGRHRIGFTTKYMNICGGCISNRWSEEFIRWLGSWIFPWTLRCGGGGSCSNVSVYDSPANQTRPTWHLRLCNWKRAVFLLCIQRSQMVWYLRSVNSNKKCLQPLILFVSRHSLHFTSRYQDSIAVHDLILESLGSQQIKNSDSPATEWTFSINLDTSYRHLSSRDII